MKKRTVFIIFCIIFVIAAVFSFFFLALKKTGNTVKDLPAVIPEIISRIVNPDSGDNPEGGEESVTGESPQGKRGGWFSGKTGTVEEEGAVIEEAITSQTNKDGSYRTPVDFERYGKITGDMYAWITIPGTNVNYPIAQSAENDSQYLRHDLYGKFANSGTLFTEHVYNTKTFNDPVTVIYGHAILDGSMFGSLQQLYSDEDTFERYDDIIIYTPEKELKYKVFAATPYDSTHILYHYDRFKDTGKVDEFLESVYTSREFSVNISDDKADGNDKILVLSTCLKGNYSKRYLVLAKLENK